MKIGVIIGSLGFGGAERVTVNLAEWWVSHGHLVRIYTTMNRPKREYVISEGVQRVRCDSNAGKFATIHMLRETVAKDRPDVILIMDTPMCVYVVPALLGLNIPFVVSERSVPNTTAIKKSTKILSHLLMHLANGFVFQTKGAKQYYSLSIQKKSWIIPNPLLVDRLPKVYTGNRTRRIVAVGRLIEAKNYPGLFDAFAMFAESNRGYVLEIYGDGYKREELQKLIEERYAHVKIKLMGAFDDVLERIKDAEVFVMASKFEGMPNALIEAMAVGMPCISTDCPCGGPADLIQSNYNGILVKNDDAKALCTALNRLTEDPVLAKRLGANAVAVRERLDIDIIGKTWLDVFSKIMEMKKR